jgi:LysM repeat protein
MLKALIILILCAAIFGGAAYFGYDIFVKPKKLAEAEKNEPPPPPPPDPTLPEFEKAMALARQGKPVEGRSALEQFLENYPYSSKIDEVQTMLGEINIALFFSSEPTPEKEAYVIKPGDALAKIERKLKVPAELIMRTNNLTDPTKLQIGDMLYVAHPQFTVQINRKEKTITLLNHGKFFKKYRPKTWNIPPVKKMVPITAKVTDKIAWRNGQRVAFGARDYIGSARWIVTNASHYTIYAEPQPGDPPTQKPPTGISLDPSEAEELATLLNRNTPVLIQ